MPCSDVKKNYLLKVKTLLAPLSLKHMYFNRMMTCGAPSCNVISGNHNVTVKYTYVEIKIVAKVPTSNVLHPTVSAHRLAPENCGL